MTEAEVQDVVKRVERQRARERYIKYWVSRTGRAPSDVYVPENLRD